MGTNGPLFPQRDGFSAPGAEHLPGASRIRAIATRERDVIRRWAERHCAEPATGEATTSGPATVDVNDGGAGIRFNFPAAARFRPISWEEWFAHFDRHDLLFVYEEEIPDRAYELWKARGEADGRDWEDWFEAERQLGVPGGGPLSRYQLVKAL